MLTEKDYCDYETCVALKELGFNTLVDWYFNENKIIVSPLARCRSTSIPRISLYEAQKWLREAKEIEVVILSKGMVGSPYYYQVYTEDYVVDHNEEYNSYEEALSEGVCKATEILKILKENETIYE